jgi:hypothetical protein
VSKPVIEVELEANEEKTRITVTVKSAVPMTRTQVRNALHAAGQALVSVDYMEPVEGET